MSEFNKFCSAAKRTAEKITTKAGELADCAATKLRIKGLQMQIDEQYEKLGELVYRELHEECDTDSEKLEVIAAIDGLFDQLTALKSKCKQEEAEEAKEEAQDEGSGTEEEIIEEPEEEIEGDIKL